MGQPIESLSISLYPKGEVMIRKTKDEILTSQNALLRTTTSLSDEILTSQNALLRTTTSLSDEILARIRPRSG